MKRLSIILIILISFFGKGIGQNYVVNSEPYFTPAVQDRTANKKFGYSPTGLACTIDCMAFSTTHKRLSTSMALQSIVYKTGPICGSSIRCENVQVKSDSTEKNKFYAGSVYFDNYYPGNISDKQNELGFQLKSVYTYTGASNKPNISIWNRQLNSSLTAMTLEIQYDTVNAKQKPTPNQVSIRIDTLETNTWLDVLVEVKWAANYTGYVKVYVNKVLKVTYNGPTKDKPFNALAERIPEALWGIYKFSYKDNPDAANTTQKRMFIDVLKIGNDDTQKEDYFINDTPVPPTVSAGATQQIKLPVNTVALVGTASDADGTISKVAWTKVSGPSITINSSTQLSTTAITTIAGTYVLKLTVTDNQGLINSDTMSIVVLPANIVPVANAGIPQTIQLPISSVTLSGSGSDEDGTISSYLWTKISGAPATIGSPTSPSTSITGLTNGTYTFRLTVTDNEGGTGFSDVVITVLPGNRPPVANAGIDRSLTLPINTIIITGSGTDPDGTISKYLWQKVSGGAVSISGNSSASLTLSDLEEGTYVFSLTVTDNQGLTGIDQMTLVVNPAPPPANVPPTSDAGSNQTITLPTNSVVLNGTGSADSDGTIVSYSWSKISGPSTYTLAGSSSVTASASNLVQGTYVFQLTVTDNRGGTGVASVTITVNPAVAPPNTPPTANAGSDATITLPTNSVSLPGSGVDSDGTITGYLWTKLSGPSVTIVNSTSATATANNLVQGTYIFQLRVTDNQGATGIDTKQVIVSPAPANQPPVVSAGPDKILRLPTNFTTLTGSASDPDGTISSRLWSRVSGPNMPLMGGTSSNTLVLFGLVQGTYVFSFRATDNSGVSRTDFVTLTVQRNRTTTFKTVYKFVNK